MTPRNWRIFPFELFILLNLLATVLFLRIHGIGLTVRTFTNVAKVSLPLFLLYMAAGLLLTIGLAAIRKDLGDYLRTFFSPTSLLVAARILLGAVILMYGYVWIKLTIPLTAASTADLFLWKLDIRVHMGLAPFAAVPELLHRAGLLHLIDLYYGKIYLPSVLLVFGLCSVHREIRFRLAFALGYAIVWGLGGWLYLTLPSMGPCYERPALYQAYQGELAISRSTQTTLKDNYDRVMRARKTGTIEKPFNPGYGIAAFPSLHVAAHAFFTLLFWRRSRSLSILFLSMTFLTFIGSLATGWHYAVDGYAGILLAVLAWFAFRIASEKREQSTSQADADSGKTRERAS
ncbi:MAG TPA: phosphatase PAP2 family protein [Thermoanaerobaculia bacterium]|nr:phosphatase PAP2 family protein [Thermoanaerobaculia bacterium]HUM30314.1 phosphatase PAP2 family protein [Thermoanaerobaculia bacterium]HXK68535.1 phosphatase PAP2 family protein [Thermoanaerobaculia bacterium]